MPTERRSHRVHLATRCSILAAALMGLLGVNTICAQTQATGTLTVKIVEESGRGLPARVHVRDAAGRWQLPRGQSTRQDSVYSFMKPIPGDWFYADGSFSIDLVPGEVQLDVVHGPAFAAVHEKVRIQAGQTLERTVRLRQLVDMPALGWYGGDEHLHQRPDAAVTRAEDLNVVAMPYCHEALVRYSPEQTVSPLPDAAHLLVAQLPAIEWDCFLWDLPKPLVLTLGGDPWPERDGGTAAELEGARPPRQSALRTPAVIRSPFVIEQAHASGACVVAYPHDPARLWYYPLYVAKGWIDVYGVLENVFCSAANRSEVEFWRCCDDNFGIWYRFLNCGYRLPASAGSDNVGMGVGDWKGYNRVYVKVDGEFTFRNWVAAWKQGRSFVTNGPILLATIEGEQPGAELAVKSAPAMPLNVDIEVFSTTPVWQIDILYNCRVLREIELNPPSHAVRRREAITVPKSGWIAVRCRGRGDNPNVGPKSTLAHTSPFYVIVDSQPIRSPDDARWLHDQFAAFIPEALSRVTSGRIRAALEAECREALDTYAIQAGLTAK